MIVDTSAILAILQSEPERDPFTRAIADARWAGLPAPAYVEAGLKPSLAKLDWLDRSIEQLGVELLPFTADHARAAAEAHRRFGRGRHPAGLNFGDCMVYAVARLAGAPLLFKGRDFALTDIEPAIPATE